MSQDYYHQLYTHTMAQYNSELADANADMVRAQASGDFAGAVSAAQRMANTRANAAAFHQLAEETAANMRGPPALPPLTREEVAAKPVERMNYLDALELANTSKYASDEYGGPLTPDDPHVQAGYRYAAQTRNQYRR